MNGVLVAVAAADLPVAGVKFESGRAGQSAVLGPAAASGDSTLLRWLTLRTAFVPPVVEQSSPSSVCAIDFSIHKVEMRVPAATMFS